MRAKARLNLIFAAVFAAVVASMVLFAVIFQRPTAVRFAQGCELRIEEQGDLPPASEMRDPEEQRVTMLRGFAYTLGRRCRVWRRSVRRSSRPMM